MPDFVPVCQTTDIPDPGKQLLEIDDRMVVLLHVAGEFFCLDDVCTHDGGPLAEGELKDHRIICPRHFAEFDIRTGRALTMPATQDTVAHEVKVEGEQVFVKIHND
jgi:3-phenylpropionate/trans-cinnamate dioxygenase ferredoxin component